MERYTKEQRIVILKTHYKYGECYAETVRKVRGIFGRQISLNQSTVKRLIEKFEETGSLLDIKPPGRPREGRSIENIAAVRQSVTVSPRRSIRRRSQHLGIPRSTMERILKKDLHMYGYKIQLTQQLKTADHLKRREFVDWILERQEVDPDFPKKIIFSDEAHFHLDGYVNKQNCRIWGTENPRVIVEKQLYPRRVTVWCGFWYGGVIGPYFFEDDAENALTVNGERYREMITHFLWPQLNNMNLADIWFQQDGATCHAANETTDLLQEKFPDHLISRNGDQNWPPRSCDLTPCDFFLWGFVKSNVYVNKPKTIPELKMAIRSVIGEIEPQLCDNVIKNFVERVKVCHQSRGGHLSDIVFHN